MVFKFVSNPIKERGITLIEIIVAIAIITLFSMILLADYPKIRRQFALSRSTYKLAQDLRKTQDLGLSGVQIAGIQAKGYGIYISFEEDKNKEYIIYADNCPVTPAEPDYEYTIGGDCNDSIIETVDISQAEREVYIKEIIRIDGNQTSINFNPPNPDIVINNIRSNESSIGIVLALSSDSSSTRTVYINTSGLIEVE